MDEVTTGKKSSFLSFMGKGFHKNSSFKILFISVKIKFATYFLQGDCVAGSGEGRQFWGKQ